MLSEIKATYNWIKVANSNEMGNVERSFITTEMQLGKYFLSIADVEQRYPAPS